MGPVGVIPSSKTDALPLLENVLYSVVVVRVYSFNKPFDSVMGGGNMVDRKSVV